MTKLTKDRVKAFIDDLAYIQEKHGVFLLYEGDSKLFVDSAGSYPRDDLETVFAKKREHCGYPIWEVVTLGEEDGALKSIDPRKLSDHGRLEKEAGLRG